MLKVFSLLALGLAAAGVALAAPSTSKVTVKVSTGLGGKLLVNASGMTLYHYTDESKGKIDCTAACTKVWPPLLAGSAKPTVGPGLVAAKLGTIKRPDGGMQVTYNGLALYRYAADKKAGDTNGQGVEGSWYAVTAAGTITKAKVSAAESAPSSSATPVSSRSGSSSSGSSGNSGTSGATSNCTPGAIVTDANSPCYNY